MTVYSCPTCGNRVAIHIEAISVWCQPNGWHRTAVTMEEVTE